MPILDASKPQIIPNLDKTFSCLSVRSIWFTSSCAFILIYSKMSF